MGKKSEADEIVVQAFDKILRDELAQAISELQSLDALLAESKIGTFKLGKPDDYTYHQQVFISNLVHNMQHALNEIEEEIT